ncbi:hypothetical protein EBS02_03880 [bacterium]|nr:hypothetical protein [bacterium]
MEHNKRINNIKNLILGLELNQDQEKRIEILQDLKIQTEELDLELKKLEENHSLIEMQLKQEVSRLNRL